MNTAIRGVIQVWLEQLAIAVVRVLTVALIFALLSGLSSTQTNAAPNRQMLIGQVLAGSTPIKNATVTLFGTVGYQVYVMGFMASAAVAETRTDAEGRFSIDLSKTLTIPQARGAPLDQVTPPPEPDSLYLVASGGDAGGGNNPAITLATALGTPPSEGRVIVNELTTVVAAFTVGYVTAAWFSEGNYLAIFPLAVLPPEKATPWSGHGPHLDVRGSTPSTKSLALANQLVDPATGLLRPVFFRGANNPALVDTLADILHSCVASRGPGFAECHSLFQASSLPEPWKLTPDNTLTAIESIVSKRSRANSAVFRLLPRERPYTPVLKQAPAGWLLSLNFSDLGLHRPTAILADPNDSTLWILNSGNQKLTELSTEPKDLNNLLLGSRKVPAPVRKNPTDFWFAPWNGPGRGPTRPQPPGWFAKSSAWLADGRLIFLNADGTNCTPPIDDLNLKGARGLSGRTVPFVAGASFIGGIFIANAGADELLVLNQPRFDCDGAGIVDRLKAPFAGAPKSFLGRPAHVVACHNFVNVWVTNGGANSVSALYYYKCPEAVPGAPFFGGGLADPEGIDCDNDGDVWIANNAPNANSLSEFVESQPGSTQPMARPPCMDGNGRGDASPVSVDALSPSSGLSGVGLNHPYGVAVDALGNVWVTNEGNDSLTVFIGAGGVPSGDRMTSGG